MSCVPIRQSDPEGLLVLTTPNKLNEFSRAEYPARRLLDDLM